MSIIDKARAFIANHTVEPRYGAVDEMVRGLIEHIDEQAALLRAKDAALEVVKDRADTWSRTASEVMEEHDEARDMLNVAMREGLSECERLRRMIETMPPWRVSEEPTDEELRALRLRWAFGPERYQGDADALIAAVLRGRERVADLRSQFVSMAKDRDEWRDLAYAAKDAAHNAISELKAENLKLRSERDRLKGFFDGANKIMDAVRGVFPPMEGLSDGALSITDSLCAEPCGECGGKVSLVDYSGKTRKYRNAIVTYPKGSVIPTCEACDARWMHGELIHIVYGSFNVQVNGLSDSAPQPTQPTVCECKQPTIGDTRCALCGGAK